MWDSDKTLRDLFEIAGKRKIRVYYNHLLPDEESFIVSRNGETYIYLDLKLHGFSEIKHLLHEISHDFVGISKEDMQEWLKNSQERRAKDWTAVYLISRKKFIKTLQNPFIRNDWEAAQEMGVDVETVERFRQYCERKGVTFRQCDLVPWYDFCTT